MLLVQPLILQRFAAIFISLKTYVYIGCHGAACVDRAIVFWESYIVGLPRNIMMLYGSLSFITTIGVVPFLPVTLLTYLSLFLTLFPLYYIGRRWSVPALTWITMPVQYGYRLLTQEDAEKRRKFTSSIPYYVTNHIFAGACAVIV